MIASKLRDKVVRYAVVLGVVLACILLVKGPIPARDDKAKLTEIFLAQPAFAQEVAAFPADEAGISAYVNVGQSIDLGKVKSAFRGIEAEGDTYVIGIMELTGLPEEEFPHMYVSQDGWVLAYYSKFAPSSRIMQWYGYEGGAITTTTLQDAISKLLTTLRIDYSKIRPDSPEKR